MTYARSLFINQKILSKNNLTKNKAIKNANKPRYIDVLGDSVTVGLSEPNEVIYGF
ncbi:hypothetical protein GCM10007915_26420 [Psychrobacter pacificensis]|uniref:Uncharacterized protein n=1 Tax=Psychrobacter pacificensis TaxID=112002 RepID=A0ABQ5Z5T3_9GAMM|nr:hypothetical protein GCM10007915_26420 [Psychrobacter pacificensis]